MTPAAQIWRQRELILNFARRELKSRYKQSLIGWAWSLVNPAATLLIYTLVFSLIFRGQPPTAGNGRLESYTIYLFIGLVAWNFFAGLLSTSMDSLLGAGSLLKKISFPAFVPVVGNGVSALVQTGIELGILVLVLAAVGNLSWVVVFVPLYFLLLAMFALGIGLIIALANVRFRDVSYLVGVALQLLFYATPIIYPPQLIPERDVFGVSLRTLFGLNPLSRFVEAIRDLLWFQTLPSLRLAVVLVVLSVGVFVAGWAIFQRRSLDVAEYL
ncbi:MAG: ABC transporter permease [Actinomycetes bacterium]